jgi:ribonuclease HI
MRVVARTDGGSRGNPGPAGIGVVIETADTHEVIENHAVYLGVTTNNQAEYKAVLLALERAQVLAATEVEVVADSELLVKQANGEYRVKNPGLQVLFARLKMLEHHFRRVEYTHVRRAYNKAADALANQAMDEGMGRIPKGSV